MQAATIVFAASVDGQDVRQVLDVGDSGYIMWCDGGDEEGFPADVFPARVSAISPVRTVAEQEHRLTVSFSIPHRPRNIVLPAAACWEPGRSEARWGGIAWVRTVRSQVSTLYEKKKTEGTH